MDKVALVKELNYALTTEYQAYIQYQTHASTLTGRHDIPVKGMLEHIADEELGHAKILRDRIAALGETPSMDVDKRVPAKDSKAAILVNLGAEKAAVVLYLKILGMLDEKKDVILYDAIRGILKDEQEHIEELDQLRE